MKLFYAFYKKRIAIKKHPLLSTFYFCGDGGNKNEPYIMSVGLVYESQEDNE
jgi:hypothetical protein